MSSLFVLEIKGAKKAKIFNFLNGCFSIMGGPIDMIFVRVFRDQYEASKKYSFTFFLKISQCQI